jgi:hypothetical protein
MTVLADMTLITCSYNTPEVTRAMLSSFVAHHPGGPHSLLLVENSTEPETARLLDAEGVPYLANPGGRHSPSVDLALRRCATRYALLVDTDVLFLRSLTSVLDGFRRHDLTVLGKVQGDRGGHRLHPRVHPWFCLIDVDRVRAHGISFHDEDRIRKSGSQGFYQNLPIQEETGETLYDVGATFYEDVDRAGLRIGDVDLEGGVFLHFEGMSWHGRVGTDVYDHLGARARVAFDHIAAPYREVSIRGAFASGARADEAPTVEPPTGEPRPVEPTTVEHRPIEPPPVEPRPRSHREAA